MKAIIAVAVLVMAARPAMGASSDDWYAIDNIEHKCTTRPGRTPGSIIENAQTAQQAYKANDITDPGSGRIVETTIELPDMGAQLTFYRGLERCQAALDQLNNSQKSDVDKYN